MIHLYHGSNVVIETIDLQKTRPYKEWVLFVINNRNRNYRNFSDLECNHDRKYDLVIGPVADDDLALLFRQFSGGLINADVLVEAMKFKKLTNQYSFHTERALGLLEKKGWYHG